MRKRYEVRVTKAALIDLRRISSYFTDNGSPAVARKIVGQLSDVFESLSSFPDRGNVPKELEEEGIFEFRQLVKKPYRIFYAVAGGEVDILLVADGRRDMPSLLFGRLLNR